MANHGRSDDVLDHFECRDRGEACRKTAGQEGHPRSDAEWRPQFRDATDLNGPNRPHIRRHGTGALTSRQWELLRLLAAGHTNADIARELVVSVSTVRKHLENIFARLGVTNRTAAIVKAFPSPPD